MPDKSALSLRIMAAATGLPAYSTARTVLFYVDVGSEVRTRSALSDAIRQGKRVVVPWCRVEPNELVLASLDHINELAIGAHGILELRPELRSRPDKHVRPSDIDLAFVPGIAFDRAGGRLGQGKGYYDRLFADVRDDAVLVGLAYEAQMVAEVPTEPHDVSMDMVVTETQIYAGRGRSTGPRA